MHVLRTIAAAAVLFCAGVSSAYAQDPTPQQYEAMMRWAAGSQQIIQTIVTPLQQLPPPIGADSSPAERTAWVAQARSWATSSAQALAQARRQMAALGPVPEAGALTAIYRNQERMLPPLIESIDAFLEEFVTGVAAIERNDENALLLAYINALDAQILVQTHFRNANALQAEAVGDGPQRYLLRSFSNSYDVTIAVVQMRRSMAVGQDSSQAGLAAIRAAGASMRENVRLGREATERAQAALPAQAPPEQSDFLRRVRLAYQSFGASFDREERMADIVDEIAQSMARGFDEAALEPLIERLSQLDFERLGDIQERTRLVQQIVPLT
jgi:hypothetical protein